MTRTAVTTAIACLLVLSACGSKAPASVTVGGVALTAEQTLLQNAAKTDVLRTLVGSIRQAKLDGTLEGKGPFTLFAPNEQAFSALPPDALTALMQPENADLLTQLLSYHVVAGTVRSADLQQGTRLRTLEGKELFVERDDKGMIKINGMPVSIADVPASNGILHIINGVLLPPVNAPSVQTSDASSSATPAASAASVTQPTPETTVSSPAAGGAVAGLIMQGGMVYRVMESGMRDPLKMDVQLSNGTKVMTNGTLMTANGTQEKLQEGEMLLMSGEKTRDLPMQQQSSSAAAAQPGTAKTMATYGVYTEGVVGNGQTSVLFFHAKWCPKCKQADAKLAELYGATKATLPTYRVDYDTSAPLKQQYGVTSQHTFVVIDGTGKALKTVLGPTDDQLLALVQGK